MPDGKGSGSKGIPHHPLVAALASDPGKPPTNATKLFGYPGPAAEKGATRLWLDHDLTTYVDIPGDAILHSQTLPDDQGTYIWVDPEAKLTYSSTQSHDVQADFLGGSIAARNLAGAPVGIGGVGGGGARTTAVAAICSLSAGCSVLPNCGESSFPDCPSTVEAICGETHPTPATVCTHLPECPQQVSVPTNCPTVFPRCRISLATQCPTFRQAQCFHSRIEICPTPTINERFASQVVCVTQVSRCGCLSFNQCPPTVDFCITIPCPRTIDCEIVGPFRPQEQ